MKRKKEHLILPVIVIVLAMFSNIGYTQSENTISKLEKEANKGNVSLMYELGVMYESAKDVVVDYSKAIYWYQKAIENGNTEARTKLNQLVENINKHTKKVATPYGSYEGFYDKHSKSYFGKVTIKWFDDLWKYEVSEPSVFEGCSFITVRDKEGYLENGSIAKFVFKNGDTYIGEWDQGFKGHGIIFYADGRKLEGEFENENTMYFYSNKHYKFGKNKTVLSDYNSVIGSKLTGISVLTLPDGTIFKGKFYNRYFFKRGGWTDVDHNACDEGFDFFYGMGVLLKPNEAPISGIFKGINRYRDNPFHFISITQEDLESAIISSNKCHHDLSITNTQFDGYYQKEKGQLAQTQSEMHDMLRYELAKLPAQMEEFRKEAEAASRFTTVKAEKEKAELQAKFDATLKESNSTSANNISTSQNSGTTAPSPKTTKQLQLVVSKPASSETKFEKGKTKKLFTFWWVEEHSFINDSWYKNSVPEETHRYTISDIYEIEVSENTKNDSLQYNYSTWISAALKFRFAKVIYINPYPAIKKWDIAPEFSLERSEWNTKEDAEKARTLVLERANLEYSKHNTFSNVAMRIINGKEVWEYDLNEKDSEFKNSKQVLRIIRMDPVLIHNDISLYNIVLDYLKKNNTKALSLYKY